MGNGNSAAGNTGDGGNAGDAAAVNTTPHSTAAAVTGQELQTTSATVLNGAQITAATALVISVAAGELPRDAGLGQLRVLFNPTPAQAEELMGAAVTSTPTTPNPKPQVNEPAAPEGAA